MEHLLCTRHWGSNSGRSRKGFTVRGEETKKETGESIEKFQGWQQNRGMWYMHTSGLWHEVWAEAYSLKLQKKIRLRTRKTGRQCWWESYGWGLESGKKPMTIAVLQRKLRVHSQEEGQGHLLGSVWLGPEPSGGRNCLENHIWS